jgi:uncharacterized protein Veg
MTTDLECQEFQKRGERKREREREKGKERERNPTDVYASLFVLYHSHSLHSSRVLLAYTSSLRSSRTHTQVAYGVLAEDRKVLVP